MFTTEFIFGFHTVKYFLIFFSLPAEINNWYWKRGFEFNLNKILSRDTRVGRLIGFIVYVLKTAGKHNIYFEMMPNKCMHLLVE